MDGCSLIARTILSVLICSVGLVNAVYSKREYLQEMLTRPFRGQSPFPTWQRLSTGAPATRSTLSALTGFVRSGLQLGHFFASDSARFQRHLSSTARKVKTGQEKPKDLAVTLHGLFGVSVFWTRIHSTLRQNNFEVAHFR